MYAGAEFGGEHNRITLTFSELTVTPDSSFMRDEGWGTTLAFDGPSDLELRWNDAAPDFFALRIPSAVDEVNQAGGGGGFGLIHARGFSKIDFQRVGGASVVIGAEPDSILFEHHFSSLGMLQSNLRISESLGFRMDGVTNQAWVRGDSLFERNWRSLPVPIVVVLLGAWLSALGAVVWGRRGE